MVLHMVFHMVFHLHPGAIRMRGGAVWQGTEERAGGQRIRIQRRDGKPCRRDRRHRAYPPSWTHIHQCNLPTFT
jgi:hypothetical protein